MNPTAARSISPQSYVPSLPGEHVHVGSLDDAARRRPLLSASVPTLPTFIRSRPDTSEAMKIGRYRLGKTIGHGAFSKVKLAEHELLPGHEVAIKILNRNKVKSLKMSEKLEREIALLKQFRHPHIIRLYEVIETPSDIFLVMEYVPGGELFELISSYGKLSEKEARRFFQQIISGVEYIHQHMVVHRDLKPENLLLDSNNFVKIADFGLSNIMRDGEFLKTSCGSPNYAAPEVISGDLYAGPEIDVWSCGVILYALLTGTLPFDDEYVPNLFKKIKQGDFKIPAYISPQCRDLLVSLLTLDPLTRITIPEIKQHPWFQTDMPAYLKQLFAAPASPSPAHPRQSSPTAASADATSPALPTSPARPAVEELDAELVDELEQIFFTVDRQRIEDTLRCGPAAELPPDAAEIATLYQLLADQKLKRLARHADTPSAPSASTSASSLQITPRHGGSSSAIPMRPGVGGVVIHGPSVSERHAALLSSTPTMNMREGKRLTELLEEADAAMLSKTHEGSAGVAPEPIIELSGTRTWTLGIVSKLAPKEIVAEVLKTLKTLDFEWKFVSAYRFRCRKTLVVNDQPKQLKMSVQLYRLSRDTYLLDFQKLEGEIFLFFEISAELLGLCSKVFHIPSIASSAPRSSWKLPLWPFRSK